MKRLVIVCGIVAVVFFILYQFIFMDRRSQLRVEPRKETRLAPLAISVNESDGESTVITEELSFNETVHNLEELDKLSNALELADRTKENAQIRSSVQRKLIKDAVVDFQVNDITATKNSINALIGLFDAYVASHKEDEYSGGPQCETIVRIPSDKLEDFMAKIEPLAKRMRSKNISTRDVTDEYIDLTARLATKRNLEKNYHEILRKATKVSEMLEVERELESVRGDIESMEGRLQYINNHVSYSTLTITYYQQIIADDEETFGQKVSSSLISGWSGLLEFVVSVLAAWPLLIIGPFVIWILVRTVRKWQLFAVQPVNKS